MPSTTTTLTPSTSSPDRYISTSPRRNIGILCSRIVSLVSIALQVRALFSTSVLHTPKQPPQSQRRSRIAQVGEELTCFGNCYDVHIESRSHLYARPLPTPLLSRAGPSKIRHEYHSHKQTQRETFENIIYSISSIVMRKLGAITTKMEHLWWRI